MVRCHSAQSWKSTFSDKIYDTGKYNANWLFMLSYNIKLQDAMLRIYVHDVWHVNIFVVQFNTSLDLYKNIIYHQFQFIGLLVILAKLCKI